MKKLAATLIVLITPILAHAGFPEIGGLTGGGGGNVNAVFDTYIRSYSAILQAKSEIAGALDLVAEQEKLAAQAGRLSADKGKDLNAASKEDKAAQAAINKKMDEVSELDPAKKILLAKGTAAYAVGAVELVDLVKQIKALNKPGITDIAASGKFKVLATVPAFVKDVLTAVPTLSKFMKKVGAEPDPSYSSSVSKLGALP